MNEPASYRILGQTLDDAAGEAFDKGARLLGLGYPGGPAVDRLAREGDPEAFAFPRSQPGEGLDLSFSGLKTSLLYRLRDLGEAEVERLRPDLAASYQRAIVDALVARAEQALAREGDRPLRRRRRGRGELGAEADARGALRAQGRRPVEPAARALHRQRGDDRRRGAPSPRRAYPGYLTLDASARLGPEATRAAA